ncbi:deoxynucleoside kinase isoform X2 [Scaptodrosophila lebanonensis]|uniref:Deoxynucleoside kinase isoform X2 n=1 Tax=Drosophila lebanonensis TaxID=7225 RepID=A0A6J2T2C7_DROLE|nr:deoxynucleoside kinase isoform X2 [Scaptodrosophila lebanonensis]
MRFIINVPFNILHQGLAAIRAKAKTCVAMGRKYAQDTQPFTVLIEGNIGSGKTTFLNHFEKYKNDICLLTEPVEKWRNVKGVNLLELMYKDPKKWAMPFQSYVTLTMLQSHTQKTDKKMKIMERSIFSARYCFVENMHRNGSLEQGMYNTLQEWYKFIEESIHVQADLIIYLRTSPEVVYERMRARARSEESCVPLKYLQELHELHEDWLIHKLRPEHAKVLVLDADLDLEKIGKEYQRSESSIFAISSTRQPTAVMVSPSKRQCMSS